MSTQPRSSTAPQDSSSAPDSTAELTAFLESIYPPAFFAPPPLSRPFVTLTYAQSLDGKIAGPGGAQIRLSGAESMVLTHRLRELHDSILVGIGTVLSDDPQLNARLPTLLPLASQPTPIILDTRLRTPLAAKLISNSHKLITPVPIIACTSANGLLEVHAFEARGEALAGQGVRLKTCRVDSENRIRLDDVLDTVVVGTSLMVEGGASVISAFLSSHLVDLVIITIAPTLVGDGIGLLREGIVPPELEHVATKAFGRDVVVVCRPVRLT